MRKWTFILAIASFVVGSAVYLLYRSPSLKVFSWLDYLHLKGPLLASRPDSTGGLPGWFLFSFPDGCWVFSYVLVIGGIWMGRIREGVVFLIILPVVAIASEVLQGGGLLRGTFDWGDLIAYLVGTLLGLCWLFYVHTKFNLSI